MWQSWTLSAVQGVDFHLCSSLWASVVQAFPSHRNTKNIWNWFGSPESGLEQTAVHRRVCSKVAAAPLTYFSIQPRGGEKCGRRRPPTAATEQVTSVDHLQWSRGRRSRVHPQVWATKQEVGHLYRWFTLHSRPLVQQNQAWVWWWILSTATELWDESATTKCRNFIFLYVRIVILGKNWNICTVRLWFIGICGKSYRFWF